MFHSCALCGLQVMSGGNSAVDGAAFYLFIYVFSRAFCDAMRPPDVPVALRASQWASIFPAARRMGTKVGGQACGVYRTASDLSAPCLRLRVSLAERQRRHRIASRGKTGRASTYKRRRRCSCWTRTSMETLYGKTTNEKNHKPFNHLAGPRRTDFSLPLYLALSVVSSDPM